MSMFTAEYQDFKREDPTVLVKVTLYDDQKNVIKPTITRAKLVQGTKYAGDYKITQDGNQYCLPTNQLNKLPSGDYGMELWADDGSIYPSAGFIPIRIHRNANNSLEQVDPTISIDEMIEDLHKAGLNVVFDKIELLDSDQPGSITSSVHDGKNHITLRIPRGLQGEAGPRGLPGENGKSAYQLAVDNGYKGTEAEWLTGLKASSDFDTKSVTRWNAFYTPNAPSVFQDLLLILEKQLKPGIISQIYIGQVTNSQIASPSYVALVDKTADQTFQVRKVKKLELSAGDNYIDLNWDVGSNQNLALAGKGFRTGNPSDIGSPFNYLHMEITDVENYLQNGKTINLNNFTPSFFTYNFALIYEENNSYITPYANKSVACLGDSITSGGRTSNGNLAISYVRYLPEYLKTIPSNFGVSGTHLANVDNSSFVSRSSSITGQDVVTVFGGTNDYCFDSPLGTMADAIGEGKTFYSALKYLIEHLTSQNPDAKLLFITPMKLCKPEFIKTFADDNITLAKNNLGFTEEQYVDAIKEVCAYYSVPVLDLFHEGNMNPYLAAHEQYYADKLHPNEFGAQRLAQLIGRRINLL